MRTVLSSLTVVLLCASALLAQRPERGRGSRAPEQLEHFTFQERSFQSDAVGQEVPYGIYLPAGYADEANKDREWPLVLWLHGMFEDHLRFHTRGGAPMLDGAVENGSLPPCIFVCVNGGRTSMYLNRKEQRWQDLITEDLLQHLDSEYRVLDDRRRRAIMGVSMGGMAALRIAFTQPDKFGAVAAHSSAVFAEDPEQLPDRMKSFASRLGFDEEFGNPIQKEKWEQANPLCIANRVDVEQLRRLRIYFDAGTADRLGFHQGNQLLHEALERREVEHTFRLIEGGGHSWGASFEKETLPHSFASIGAMFKAELAVPTGETDGNGGTKPAPGEKRDD